MQQHEVAQAQSDAELPPARRIKVNINQMILEVTEECARRDREYDGLVRAGRMRGEEALVRKANMAAVKTTLMWLRIIEPKLKDGRIGK